MVTVGLRAMGVPARKEWYVDAVNFHSTQTKEYLDLPIETRKLLIRIDRKRYVQRLEQAFEGLGGNLSALKGRSRKDAMDKVYLADKVKDWYAPY